MHPSLTSIVTALLVTSWVAAGLVMGAAQPARGGQPSSALHAGLPELPSGAIRLVNYARYGNKLAMCGEEPGPPLEQSGRLIPRTRVWVDDGVETRLVGTAPGHAIPCGRRTASGWRWSPRTACGCYRPISV